MSDTPADVVENEDPPRRSRRRWRRHAIVLAVMLLLFGVPWWTLLAAGPAWPTAVVVACTLLFAAAFAGLPLLMMHGHGRRHLDRAAAAGDALLGAAWVLFVWSVLGHLLELALVIAGVEDPVRSRVVAAAVVAAVVVLLAWGHFEAMRVPRVRTVDVGIAGLGAGLDGLRVAMITDTHYGPIDRARWSAAVVERVNDLDADVVCHVGDIADGTVAVREAQASPLASVRAASARVYVTGNHEYFSEAQGWLDYMESIGWAALHNRHIVVDRGGDRLVVAGVDDATAAGSGVHGHGANLQAALEGADRALPVLLLAHQPKQVPHAVRAGVDLQISGHTHGGQIWPFNFLVRLDQPVVQGLSRHGERTQLYTSRGTGFWGPPFRVFAPSEITLLTLRRA
ncbi:metallophosphoesterase [Mycolicibacterium arseniciresistens]|uniref:Metallophosphoesterase n=1 Tax=Mycolicibacterium arseniciresistens TaxID=3062257 RepID=A0ABT8UD28_9MYCO|nr:metallophosphoesterase [Mycolicibacterium arseniciresistens]MDO3635692.1 metallophosphoesterase [Mycolicibacterium arseniciresistens]